MPVLARFYGIVIKMYLLGREHGIAHIHAIYGEYAGVIDVSSCNMLEGDLPDKALSMVQEWTAINRETLLDMWETQKFRQLPPLE
ncbi:MAG: DUF4160 domain-containing protein [Victivallales bacterium]|jgi:hypothetical protein|nr:DUF4160 domain-containing protein [Victivallales bacterium]